MPQSMYGEKPNATKIAKSLSNNKTHSARPPVRQAEYLADRFALNELTMPRLRLAPALFFRVPPATILVVFMDQGDSLQRRLLPPTRTLGRVFPAPDLLATFCESSVGGL
ncbi:MAG: hypothetical protein M1828_005018 [Chrysothrix sp. TS-e1954]|nr:MAG: hypothetical protein M1828_005018 [Chrysothrix sp. TS-e1954]